MAGLVSALPPRTVVGVPVLKHGEFVKRDIDELLLSHTSALPFEYELLTEYHYGGYAKVTPELIRLIHDFQTQHNLPLDPVYTGKLMAAIVNETRDENIKRGTTILALHSGGLQGAPTLMNTFGKA
jgi:1-aminocyclopropane-1-carboxylate deaminase